MSRDGNEIPILAGAISVIEFLSTMGRPVSISEIVAACGLSRSSAYRIIKTCERHRWVEETSRRSHYRLGSGLLSKANQAAQARVAELPRIARSHMERAAARSGQTVKLSIVDGHEAFTVDIVVGRGDYALVSTAGTHFPLHAGATGKLLLAGLPDSEQNEFLGSVLYRHTRNTITDPELLRREIERIRQAGWAEDNGEYDPVCGAFAAPIVDSEGRVAAAISITFLIGRVPPAVIRDLVVETARAISHDFHDDRVNGA